MTRKSPFFKYKLQPNGEYRKIHLSRKEARRIFGGQLLARSNRLKLRSKQATSARVYLARRRIWLEELEGEYL